MSKLRGILQKVKVQTLSFEKHPCRELDQEMMMHYLNGLALIASADENICEKEKEYLEILINSFEIGADFLLSTGVHIMSNATRTCVIKGEAVAAERFKNFKASLTLTRHIEERSHRT